MGPSVAHPSKLARCRDAISTLVVAALLLTGCAASSMMGYASQHRVACIRWTFSLWKGTPVAPLDCVAMHARQQEDSP